MHRMGTPPRLLEDPLPELAVRIARIPPPNARRPHAFHEERSEVVSMALRSPNGSAPVAVPSTFLTHSSDEQNLFAKAAWL